jgi:hypothetical protein
MGARSDHGQRLIALPYKWKQELGEVDITIPVPKGTRARDLAVVIQKKKLSVGLKGKDKIMEGELCKEIKLEESTWTLGEALHSSNVY